MESQDLIMMVISLICSTVFYSIGVFASKLEKPLWFWSGEVIDPNKVKDIKVYNNANAKMWKAYGLLYFVTAFISLFKLELGIILLTLISTIGIVGLIWCYEMIIKRKYMY